MDVCEKMQLQALRIERFIEQTLTVKEQKLQVRNTLFPTHSIITVECIQCTVGLITLHVAQCGADIVPHHLCVKVTCALQTCGVCAVCLDYLFHDLDNHHSLSN